MLKKKYKKEKGETETMEELFNKIPPDTFRFLLRGLDRLYPPKRNKTERKKEEKK